MKRILIQLTLLISLAISCLFAYLLLNRENHELHFSLCRMAELKNEFWVLPKDYILPKDPELLDLFYFKNNS